MLCCLKYGKIGALNKLRTYYIYFWPWLLHINSGGIPSHVSLARGLNSFVLPIREVDVGHAPLLGRHMRPHGINSCRLSALFFQGAIVKLLKNTYLHHPPDWPFSRGSQGVWNAFLPLSQSKSADVKERIFTYYIPVYFFVPVPVLKAQGSTQGHDPRAKRVIQSNYLAMSNALYTSPPPCPSLNQSYHTL